MVAQKPNVGDRVRVIEDVWDDSRNKSWLGWEGIVQPEELRENGDPYTVFVFFPKARGNYRYYAFIEEELEVLNA